MTRTLSISLLLLTILCFAQVSAYSNTPLKGTIKNYSLQPLYLFQCYGDTLLLSDSALTNAKGEFAFSTSAFSKAGKLESTGIAARGLFKIVLQHNQFFYIIYDGSISGSLEIQTLYSVDPFYNVATDSLAFMKGGELAGNQQFYEFQQLQQSLNVANYWLLQMMRLYPLHDPFHKQIEDEYFNRYESIRQFVKRQMEIAPQAVATKLAEAYYQPVLPDWKDPDPDRNQVFAKHYFDYFNPADSFYLHTNILPEKMEAWFAFYANSKESQNWNEKNYEAASDSFLSRLKNNQETFEFTLAYLFKKARKAHYDNAFLYLYDNYLKTEDGSCEPSNTGLNWVRETANALRNIQVGSVAPDFDIEKGALRMHQLQADYTLLIFWASWCPHCTSEIPRIKKAVDELNQKLNSGKARASLTGGDAGGKIMITVAVSLDTDHTAWQNYVKDNNLFTWVNTSELKGWNGEVLKQYNVYATPTMFLLDENKKIIAKPETVKQLTDYFNLKN